MASYTTTEALHMILNSTDDFDLEDDPDSGDESDIQEDPLFPLPRQDSSEDESVNGEGGSGDEFAEGERNESEEQEGQPGDTAAEDGSDSDEGKSYSISVWGKR